MWFSFTIFLEGLFVCRARVVVRVFRRLVLHIEDVRPGEPAEHDGERRGIGVLGPPCALGRPVVLGAVGRGDQYRDGALYIAVIGVASLS